MKCKIFCRRHFEIFFPQKIGFDISCKLSPQETVCVKCQNQFWGKETKKSSICLQLNLSKKMVKDVK